MVDANERARQSFLASVAARQTLVKVATLLGADGIPVMPLKGNALQLVHGADPVARPVTDLDLLVPPEHFDDAVKRLQNEPFSSNRPTSLTDPMRNWLFVGGPGLISVDLHGRLFGRSRYAMDTAGLFARGQRDERIGVSVVWPHPHDLFAHLAGHFVKDRIVNDTAHHPDDFAFLMEAAAIDPEALARHLRDVGLHRAALFTLAMLPSPSPSLERLQTALQAGRRDRLFVRAALEAVGTTPKDSLARRLTEPLLNDSVPEVLRGALLRRLA